MALSLDKVLAQIGLKYNGDKNSCSADESAHHLASKALAHLVQTGKLSVQDAAGAVASVKANRNTASTNKSDSTKTIAKHINNVREKYRTRHVALQFSYDGTNFSGFAQNIGKEEDNSIEKALFAALEKTRLLLDPSLIDFSIRSDGGVSEVAAETNEDMSARTASKYSRCGRTDKGVHANGQVVALYLKSAFPLAAKLPTESKQPGELLRDDDLPKNSLDNLDCFVPRRNKKKAQSGEFELKTITEFDYPRILNNILPQSIRVLGWCPVSPEFSARFSCSKRTYRYFFPRRNLNLDAMANGLREMIGNHDFRNFCKMNCEQVYNFERKITSGRIMSPQAEYKIIEVVDDDGRRCECSKFVPNSDGPEVRSTRDMCYVEIVGQAFLWHQIRCIMSVLFLIGRGLERPAVVEELLDITTNPAKPSYDMASENALVLQDCTFTNLTLGRSVKNLWDVTKALEVRWEKHAVAAERARDLIETVKKAQVFWTDLAVFIEQIATEKNRKLQKRDGILSNNSGEKTKQLLLKHTPISVKNGDVAISWETAVDVIEKVLRVFPHLPNGVNENTKGLTESSIHTPLMKRARGTTYEEKVQSILGVETANGKTSKRKERYEENIIKKRKTAEEDKAFYDHMLKQGGSSV